MCRLTLSTECFDFSNFDTTIYFLAPFSFPLLPFICFLLNIILLYTFSAYSLDYRTYLEQRGSSRDQLVSPTYKTPYHLPSHLHTRARFAERSSTAEYRACRPHSPLPLGHSKISLDNQPHQGERQLDVSFPQG